MTKGRAVSDVSAGGTFYEAALTAASLNPRTKEPEIQGCEEPLHVVHITAEMAPMAKVGGLGDVVHGLARACHLKGHDVEVILPGYSCVSDSPVWEDTQDEGYFDCTYRGGTVGVRVVTARVHGVRVVRLIPQGVNYFQGGRIYGGGYNEMEAYLFFCRAALEWLLQAGRRPQAIHLHDWHTAACSFLYWEEYYGRGLNSARLCLTIHNLDHTGECRQDELSWTGLDGASFATMDRALDPRTIGHNPERLSLLKGGIVFCNSVVTVSPTYRQETLQGGAYMNKTLQDKGGRYLGVLNGIDVDEWNPAEDRLFHAAQEMAKSTVPFNFDASNVAGKKALQAYVRAQLGLRPSEGPLVICVTRLVPQKGAHLIRHAIFRTIEKGGQFVLLGSGHLSPEFERLQQNELRDSPDAKIFLFYSDPLSHFLYGAADMCLVPSMFEPCGLTQMISMRYGSIPVVRRTGGLADTVRDVNETADWDPPPNGFVFDGADERSLDSALDRAIDMFTMDPKGWTNLMKNAMEENFSWGPSADAYINLYRENMRL